MTRADVFLIPFSVLWGGFAIFWFFAALAQGGFGFALFGLPFAVFGLYFIAGRFVYKRWKAQHTLYALTDQRVMEVSTARGRSVRAEFIDRIAAINHRIRPDGSGTIMFGNRSRMSAIYGNSGLDSFIGFSGFTADPGIAFYDVPDARTVVEHLNRLRRT